ncbi:striated muscle preferentially expressed protein kinase isoform X3 [Triplophysa rosa]|uniref:striated muscle preferentially expressed protein kinase isoform X3 n=1 Tax=Triplophysa rosa TaxID=992332 RepID=UPI002545CB74|nr:striated muscle preferentially expressed protein kinase isoform X3 [Triplophysa rosa]
MQRAGHSSWTFGRFTHVFRLCRKQSNDSDNTEDESGEPQVSMETKKQSVSPRGQAVDSQPTSSGGTMVSHIPCHGLVVEREMRILGCRAPGLQDPLPPVRPANAGAQLDFITRKASPFVQTHPFQKDQSHVDLTTDPTTAHNGTKTAVNGAEHSVKTTLPLKSSPSSQSGGSQDASSPQTPKPSRASSKIFDKVRAFEEKRHSIDIPKVSSRRPWGFNRALSCDSEDAGSKAGRPKDNSDSDVALKRTLFKQKASSFEERSSYVQKVQNFQCKFSEELSRIKKLVGKTNIKKAFSMEQLSQADKQSTGTPEAVPAQASQKFEDTRENKDINSSDLAKTEVSSLQNKELSQQQEQESKKPGRNERGKSSKSRQLLDGAVISEGVTFNKIPGRCSPRKPKKNASSALPETPVENSAAQLVPQESLVQSPLKPPRLFGSSSTLPKSIKERDEKKDSSSVPKVTIPTIVVEHKPVEVDKTESDQKKANFEDKVEGRTKYRRNRRKIHSSHSVPIEKGDSSDDSYNSAEEDPSEAPVFKLPLKDVVAAVGSEVILQCVISGNPIPEVTWRKGNTGEIKDSTNHTGTAERGQHSLRITQMKPSDAGSYTIMATNTMGQASSTATLFIKSDPVHVRGKLSLPTGSDTCISPTPSDEEFLRPVEEEMKFGVNRILPSRTDKSPFKEPPSFKIALTDQVVTEGCDIILCVQVSGQPKPVVQWFRDRVPVKADGQQMVCEMDDGKCEVKIKSAQKSDAGVYSCKISNEYGSEQIKCRLEVKDAPAEPCLTITRPVQDVRVKAGEIALFECYMAGPQDVDVDWLANGKMIQPALFDCKMQFNGHRCRLLLKSVHEDDTGTYTCKLSSAKEELMCTANLLVIPSKEPLFTWKLQVLEVIEGRSARFDCKVSGTPSPKVTWTHCEQPVVETDNIRILKEKGRHSLVITHVTQENGGYYTAIARNIHGKAESSAELLVQESRPAISTHMSRLEKMPSIPEEPEAFEGEVECRVMPDFIKPLGDQEVIEGKEAVLKCRVTGLPYPTITWYHNSKKIESTEDRKMTQYRDVHSLVIRSVCHGHSGVYKCVISNKVGKAACYAHLYVADILPEPPDGPPVIESVTGRTVSLSWKRPKNLDSSIDSDSLKYAVQQQTLGSIQWMTVASSLRDTSYTVTSLKKGVRYSFRILSTAGKAFSKPSQPTDLVQLIDKGQYLCKAPIILDKPDTAYVVENQPVTITVTLNHVQATPTWKRRGVALINRPGVLEMTMPDDDQHALHIAKVKSTDVGQLIYMANNQYGSDLCTLQLVMAVPPVFEIIMEDLDVCLGETAHFVVIVDGQPEPDILWYKDSTLLAESSHYTFVYDDRESSLVIHNAQLEDLGVYTCTAENLAGSVSCKAELTVHTGENVEEDEEPIEDKGTILRRMRRLTDYYGIHKEIGRGAFSFVKKVTQKKDKVDYAAKFISARIKRKSSALREMALLSELDHEKIVHYHDAFEKKHVLVIITELCHEQLLERITKRVTIMESEIQSIIQQLLKGISYLHQNNIIHLDIKPENILMADRRSDDIRICDFGNAVKITPNEELYCKFGTPEFIAPEIVNQSPISKSTDIWPVGVITYLCLTGVSPFAGENDRDTLLNIRNYNIAFEESMFKDLCREAKGFIIKLLVAGRLRPDTTGCLRHSWFKALTTGKNINTTLHKQVLARRKWQCSLIRYKSKMVMRSIPELLDDSSSHVSLAVPRNLKEGSSPPSSSSDEDIDELPFIPMPLTMMFSGSRMSLTEIHEDDDNVSGGSQLENIEGQSSDGHKDERQLQISESADNSMEFQQKGSSVEDQQVTGKSRRAMMRRGSSADSALLLHITPEYDDLKETMEDNQKNMKKAVSMELPNRSNSPKTSKLSKEDYALKLELMRQRLLRGGSVDKNMSGLRGPLLETLGVNDGANSLDQNLRRARSSASGLSRASSTDSEELCSKMTAFKKSASFSYEDTDKISLHRRSGAPLEIPFIPADDRNKQNDMSAVTDQIVADLLPDVKPATSEVDDKPMIEEKAIIDIQSITSFHDVPRSDETEKMKEHTFSQDNLSVENNEGIESPLDILPHDKESNFSNTMQVNNSKDVKAPPTQLTTEHPAVFAKVASTSSISQPTLRTDIKNIDSEEVFEARFKKRESSLTRGLKRLTRTKSEEKSPVFPRKPAEDVYRRGPIGAPLELVPRGLQHKSKSVQDLREVERESGFGIIGRFSMHSRKSQTSDKKEESSDSAASKRRVTWALGRSKSLDKKVTTESTEDTNKELSGSLKKDSSKVAAESPVLAMRRKFESRISERVHKTKDRKESKETKPNAESVETHKEENQDVIKINDSPVLTMQRKIESKVHGFSLRKRSQSEDRAGEKETKNEGTKTPLFSRHRHTQSDGLIHKNVDIPENQLASQTAATKATKSKESLESLQSSQTPESERRSRWDRWGLSRSKRDRSKANTPSTAKEDFPPVFHIRLKDHVLLEEDPVTLCCLPAGSPEPKIVWIKDKKPLEICNRISLIACPDGRQLLMIMKISKTDAGLYECLATNNLGSTFTSCALSFACVPKRPGTPEIPQIYNNTALVLWKPSDTKAPCTYTLERKSEGDAKWLIVATGLTDCFYNTTDFPSGSIIRFRVACVNKAGQGPYSNISEPVGIDIEVAQPSQPPTGMTPTSASCPVVTSTVTPSSIASPTSVGLTLKTKPALPPATSEPNTASIFPTSKGIQSDITPKVPVSSFIPPKSLSPLVSPKPTSPINVVPPLTQTQTVSPRPYTAPPLVGTPCSPVPTFVPPTTAWVTPTPVSPPVDISPVRQRANSPTTETPEGRVAPSTKTEISLKQAVPQKPYIFLDEKARGRFGVIRDCRENTTGKMFMAKIVPYDQETKHTVVREYEILKSLHSERIMTLHEAYVTPRYLVLITESCTGKEILYSLTDRFRYSEDDIVGFIVQILQGLEYLHNHRILHLDIKPDNIMVTNLSVIKIIDFGSAQSFNPLSLQNYSRDLGTLEYMAPEMLKGDVVGTPAEIWSLGILSYIMLSGRLPYHEKDQRQTEAKIHAAKFDSTKLYPNVSQSASTFLKKTLNGYPWSRPTIKDCLNHAWLQDSYLVKLRRQTLTFTTTRLKEFLGDHQRRRAEAATQHKVLLRAYQSGPPSPASPTMPSSPSTPVSP